ncbi:outer membrane beta-barrel protein [Desulfobacterota bacterium M19]
MNYNRVITLLLCAMFTGSVPPGARAAGTVPAAGGSIDNSILGGRGGYAHPFISMAEAHTDNIYNTRENKVGDFKTIISPGVWLALPRQKKQLLNIDTSSFTPGGLNIDITRPKAFRRYQTYLLFRDDLTKYAVHSEENTTDYTAEGLCQYNFKGGFSTSFIDQYLRSHDKRGTGVSTELDKYKNNLADFMLAYDLNPRLKLSVRYSNYKVNYDAGRNDYRDRTDNAFSAYAFYRLSSKTSLFTEYRHIDISYNTYNWRDSTEHHAYAGVKWNITGKSQGTLKAGYVSKDFKNSIAGSKNDFTLSLTGFHHFTPKTSLQITAARKIIEPDIPTSDFSQLHSISCRYRQRLTARIIGEFSFAYSNEQYDGVLNYAGETKKRIDKIYTFGPVVKYRFKRWIGAAASYSRSRRDSSFSDFDYTNNIFLVRLTTSL